MDEHLEVIQNLFVWFKTIVFTENNLKLRLKSGSILAQLDW